MIITLICIEMLTDCVHVCVCVFDRHAWYDVQLRSRHCQRVYAANLLWITMYYRVGQKSAWL